MTHAALKDLLPCPFCGRSHVSVIEDKTEAHLVVCEDCISAGPPEQSEAEAIAAWNRRAARSAMEGEAVAGIEIPAGHLFALLMCSDPWPVRETGYGTGQDEVKTFADLLARRMGFLDWIDAYHGTNQSFRYVTAPPPQQAASNELLLALLALANKWETYYGDSEIFVKELRTIATHPTPSPGPQGGGEAQLLRLTARQARVAQFALRRFANDARLGADDAAQKAGADKYPKGAAARFLQDADDAEAILAALATPPAHQPGEVGENVYKEAYSRMVAGAEKALDEIEDAGPKALKYAAQEIRAALQSADAALAPKEAGHG